MTLPSQISFMPGKRKGSFLNWFLLSCALISPLPGPHLFKEELRKLTLTDFYFVGSLQGHRGSRFNF